METKQQKLKKLHRARLRTSIILLFFIIPPLVYYEVCLHDPYDLIGFCIFTLIYSVYVAIVAAIITTIHDNAYNDNIGYRAANESPFQSRD